jgi:hypothetical protein
MRGSGSLQEEKKANKVFNRNQYEIMEWPTNQGMTGPRGGKSRQNSSCINVMNVSMSATRSK